MLWYLILKQSYVFVNVTILFYMRDFYSGRKTSSLDTSTNNSAVDIFIIGGGVNECGMASHAAGLGLNAGLAEQGDLAQGTRSP